MQKVETQMSAHSAAAALVRELVEAKQMTRDDAIKFTDWIDRQIKLGRLPDDPLMLGLVQQGEWRTASSDGLPVQRGRVMGVGRTGISLKIVKPRKSITR